MKSFEEEKQSSISKEREEKVTKHIDVVALGKVSFKDRDVNIHFLGLPLSVNVALDKFFGFRV
jgi:hypothetical protein